MEDLSLNRNKYKGAAITAIVMLLGIHYAFLNFILMSAPKNQYFCYQRPDMVQAMMKVASQEQVQIQAKISEMDKQEVQAVEKIKTASIKAILRPLVVAENK